MFTTGVCHHCNGRIEFKVEQSGQTVECQFCGRQTVLYKSPNPSRVKKIHRKPAAPAIIAVVTAVILAAATIAFQVVVGIQANKEWFGMGIGGILLLGTTLFTIANKSEW
jgi:hypothetical protein